MKIELFNWHRNRHLIAEYALVQLFCFILPKLCQLNSSVLSAEHICCLFVIVLIGNSKWGNRAQSAAWNAFRTNCLHVLFWFLYVVVFCLEFHVFVPWNGITFFHNNALTGNSFTPFHSQCINWYFLAYLMYFMYFKTTRIKSWAVFILLWRKMILISVITGFFSQFECNVLFQIFQSMHRGGVEWNCMEWSSVSNSCCIKKKWSEKFTMTWKRLNGSPSPQ